MLTNLRLKDKLSNYFSRVKFQKVLLFYGVLATLLALVLNSKLKYRTEQYKTLLQRSYSNDYTSPTITPIPTRREAEVITCISDKDTIYSANQNFAACLEDEKYNVYKKTFSIRPYGYRRFWQESGRIEADNEILISYADYYRTSNDLRPHEISSPVFRINKTAGNLELLFDSLDIPNIKDWINGSEFSAQFILFSENETWTFSPNRNILLLRVAPCIDCDAGSGYLYAYNFLESKLIFIGQPYSQNDEDANKRFFIEWLDSETLKWREGLWRERRDEEYESGYDYPAVQDDLGYKVTRL